MLKAIKELGEYLRENKDIGDVQVLTESSKLPSKGKMICVVLRRENDDLVFDSVHIEDFGQDKAKKILFRTFRHGRYNAFLTSIITTKRTSEKSVENMKNRWMLWFQKYFEQFKDKYPILNLLKNEIDEKEEDIFAEVLEKYDQLNREDKLGCILTIKIKEDTCERYPAEVLEFTEIFKETSLEDLYSKHGIVAKGRGVCAFCSKEDEVMPASPFAVFTVKKVGFAYNFERQNSWKQLPICKDCAFDLQIATQWIMDKEKLNLSFTLFRDYQYFVIPNFVFKEVSDEIISEIELRKNDDYREGLLNAEDDILEMIKEKKDVLNLIFVFYKRKQQFFDIIRYVEEVPPSWIKKIYDVFRSINRKDIFSEKQLKTILGEKWSGDFKEGKSMWNGKPVSKLNLAGMVGEFFYHREKDKKIFDKSSLNILGDILEAKQIDRGYFIKHLIEAIREEYGRNEWSEKLLSLKSLYLFDFLIELGLVLTFGKNLRFKGVKLMEETIIKDSKSVEDFFKEFQNAFDTPDKKAVFLEGVLVSFLLDVQYAKRKDTPFRKKLHGLRLNKRLIKRLFPEIIEKLRQYDAGYPWLETLISKYFIEADETDWIISDDEISYYFALGLNFGRIFKGGELGE